MFTPTLEENQNDNLPLEMGYAELPAWLRAQEELSASEFHRFTRQPVREILNLYDDIRQQIIPLQALDVPPDARPGTGAVLQAVLATFDPASGLLAFPAPEDFDTFYDHAWNVCHRCDSCFMEYSHLLLPVYSDLVLTLHTGRDGIRREVGTIAPAVTEFRLLTTRIAKIRKIFSAIQRIDAETRISMAKETRATADIYTHREKLAAIALSIETLESDPEEFAARKYLELVQLRKEKARLRTTYDKLAGILTGMTRRAEDVAGQNGDHEALRILKGLTAILESGEVPDGDELFSALINGYTVLLEIVENGDLELKDETEQYLCMDAGAFNNGMRNLCKDYRVACGKCDSAASAPQHTDASEKKMVLERERNDLESLLRDEVAVRDEARAFQEITAMHRQTMARMIEDSLLEMTGRPVRLRLSWPPAGDGAE